MRLAHQRSHPVVAFDPAATSLRACSLPTTDPRSACVKPGVVFAPLRRLEAPQVQAKATSSKPPQSSVPLPRRLAAALEAATPIDLRQCSAVPPAEAEESEELALLQQAPPVLAVFQQAREKPRILGLAQRNPMRVAEESRPQACLSATKCVAEHSFEVEAILVKALALSPHSRAMTEQPEPEFVFLKQPPSLSQPMADSQVSALPM
jgi:hypothetical protein